MVLFNNTASKDYGTLARKAEPCASYWINKPQANLPRRASGCEINYSHIFCIFRGKYPARSFKGGIRIGCAWRGVVTVPGVLWVWAPFAPFRKEARREGPIINGEVGNSLMPGDLVRYGYRKTKGKTQVTIHPSQLNIPRFYRRKSAQWGPSGLQGTAETKTSVPQLPRYPFVYVFHKWSPFQVLSVPRTQLTKPISVGHCD